MSDDYKVSSSSSEGETAGMRKSWEDWGATCL